MGFGWFFRSTSPQGSRLGWWVDGFSLPPAAAVAIGARCGAGIGARCDALLVHFRIISISSLKSLCVGTSVPENELRRWQIRQLRERGSVHYRVLSMATVQVESAWSVPLAAGEVNPPLGFQPHPLRLGAPHQEPFFLLPLTPQKLFFHIFFLIFHMLSKFFL